MTRKGIGGHGKASTTRGAVFCKDVVDSILRFISGRLYGLLVCRDSEIEEPSAGVHRNVHRCLFSLPFDYAVYLSKS